MEAAQYLTIQFDNEAIQFEHTFSGDYYLPI